MLCIIEAKAIVGVVGAVYLKATWCMLWPLSTFRKSCFNLVFSCVYCSE